MVDLSEACFLVFYFNNKRNIVYLYFYGLNKCSFKDNDQVYLWQSKYTAEIDKY